MNILEVQNLCKTYGKGEAAVQALRDVTFSVHKGEFVAIVGESGSGKSTLLNVVGALDKPTAGKVLIDGKDIFSMPEKKLTVFRRQHIGFIFQSFNLIPELNVEQNITFPLLLDYKKPDQKFVNELLQVLGLTERRNHLPSQLSGGQQQRVAIGRALVTHPALIMADEPTGNLDSKNSQETVVLLSHKKADSYIHIDVEFGEGEGKIPVDSIAKRAEAYKPKEKVTYKMIKEYIEAKYGFKVHTAYIAEVKRNLGLPMYDAPNAVEELKQPRKHPTPEKVEAIKDALRYFAVI